MIGENYFQVFFSSFSVVLQIKKHHCEYLETKRPASSRYRMQANLDSDNHLNMCLPKTVKSCYQHLGSTGKAVTPPHCRFQKPNEVPSVLRTLTQARPGFVALTLERSSGLARYEADLGTSQAVLIMWIMRKVDAQKKSKHTLKCGY